LIKEWSELKMTLDFELLKKLINQVYDNRTLLQESAYQKAVFEVIGALNNGSLRVASPVEVRLSEWQVNDWVKKGILLYFALQKMEPMDAGIFEYHDKIPLKKRSDMPGVRAVPGAVVRTGTFVEAGAILMPSFVNIGAYVSEGTMVDTWATVGSCAQIGKRVHLSGGVGIGGVLEPPQAAPVIIEDDVFVGSRCIVVEGVHVKKGAVLGANVVLTASTKIIDVSASQAIECQGVVPENSVVIPGVREKKFSAGSYGVPCALIIGKRKASTDLKTSLNQALRDFEISV
jgi:2,3,4,5-tetrahydropyridine-2-carboxylate N-succinyltransferase